MIYSGLEEIQTRCSKSEGKKVIYLWTLRGQTSIREAPILRDNSQNWPNVQGPVAIDNVNNLARQCRSTISVLWELSHCLTWNLKSTESTKYLGVTLTKDLAWGKHVDIIRAKANQQLAFVRRNIRTRSSSTKEKLFHTLVRPHLVCCDCMGPAHLQAETLAGDDTTKTC